jgi:hypothetical protein
MLTKTVEILAPLFADVLIICSAGNHGERRQNGRANTTFGDNADLELFENVSEGDALYMRTSDGQVGKASASNGLQENAQVVGFANADASANATVKVIVIGLKTMSGLDAGDLYFLSPSTAGAITLTPPSSAGQAVVRVGEASTATKFAIRIEPPIKLS